MKSNRLVYGSHSFLNEYISENKCKRIMEIGVADGEPKSKSYVNNLGLRA